MDVVRGPADTDGRTPEVIRGGGKIRMEIFPKRQIGETGFPVLRRKNKVNKNTRKRLRHIQPYNNNVLSCRVRDAASETVARRNVETWCEYSRAQVNV